jgi:hypothetical protein
MPRRPLLLLLAALLLATPARSEFIGNPGIIALHEAGLSAEAIAAKVRHAPCDYDLSTTGLIALKRASVPQAAIVAMLEHCGPTYDGDDKIPAAAHTPGIFLQTPSGETLVRPSAWSSLGLGGYLFPTMARLVVPQATAQLTTGLRPVFVFRFAPQPPDHADFGGAESQGAQSPTEFSLVRFREQSGNRQVTVGRVQANIEITGIDPKYTLPFTVKELGNGQFRVEMPEPLEPGQYGFVIMGERQRRRGTLFRIYDFAVKADSR